MKLWPARLSLPLTWRKLKRIFVNLMSDLFHRDVPEDYILKVFETMKAAPRISVESQEFVERVDFLRKTGAAVKFLSVEPLLGPIEQIDLSGIDWVIVGGELGGHKKKAGRLLDGRTWDALPRGLAREA